MNDSGFVTRTRRGDKQVEETTWDYDADFGIQSHTAAEMVEYAKALSADEKVTIIVPNRVKFVHWQCQRATSENLTNAATSVGKGTPHSEAVKAVLAKRDSLKRGEIALGGGAGMDPVERAMREIIQKFLIAKNVQSGMAATLSRNVDEAVQYVTKVVFENDTAEERERIYNLFEKAAEKKVQQDEEAIALIAETGPEPKPSRPVRRPKGGESANA